MESNKAVALSLLLMLLVLALDLASSIQVNVDLMQKVARGFILKKEGGGAHDVDFTQLHSKILSMVPRFKEVIDPLEHVSDEEIIRRAEVISGQRPSQALEFEAGHSLTASPTAEEIQERSGDPVMIPALDSNKLRFREQVTDEPNKQANGVPEWTPVLAEMYEDCMACRLVWRQVEMDVSNARYVEDVHRAFLSNCAQAQGTEVFYKACNDMSELLRMMLDDYMSQKYTVDEMCIRAKMCLDSESMSNKPENKPVKKDD